MSTVENIGNFFELELNTIDGTIGIDATPIRAIFEEPPSQIAGMRGSDPQITLRRSEVPAGTAIGDLVSFGLMQYKIRDRVGAGKDLVRFRLQAGPTKGSVAFYEITVAPGEDPPALTLDMEEGWPDDITHYLTCVQGGYIMLPSSLDVSAIVADGLLTLVDDPTRTPGERLYFYGAGRREYDEMGEIVSERFVQLAHDWDTDDYGFYLSIPIGSVIGLPGWRPIEAMVSSGLLTPLNW